MCGRFTLFEPDKVLAKEFGVSDFPSRSPRYNIAPTQPIATVRAVPAGSGRELALLRWGLIPSWSKDPAIGNRLIHARMPVILPPGEYDRWLDPSLKDTNSLTSLLVPFPPEEMLAIPVSPRVN